MKKLIKRITGAAALAFALATPLGAIWAETSLEETGGYVKSGEENELLAFKSATLDDVKDHLRVRMAGAWVSQSGKEATVFNYSINDNVLTCEAQIDGEVVDGNAALKSVFLTFTYKNGNVYVYSTGAKYKTQGSDPFPTSIASNGSSGSVATSISANGYGLYYLALDRTVRSNATVVWESDFATNKVGADGYEYGISDLKGNTIDGDGNIAIGSENNHYGVVMTLPDQTKTKMTVLIKYKNLAAYTVANSGLFSFKTADDKVYGFRSNGTGHLDMTGFREDSGSIWTPSPSDAITICTGTGVYLVSTDTARGISGYTGKGISALEGAMVAPYASGSTITSITLGGSHNTNKIYAWDGVTIEKVAIFKDECYGPSDLAGYIFPGDVASIPSQALNTINVNFKYSGNLTTGDNVGLLGVPGTLWDNMSAVNGAQGDIKVVDSAAANAYSYPELAVKVSGARGSYACTSLVEGSDLRYGYIDEGASALTPTVTVGVPFDKYRVIVYHATDSNGAQFGYDTINGHNLCYDSDNWLRDGSGATSWGNAGGQNTALAIEEGKNTLVSDVFDEKPLKIVAHRESSSVRGCIAAVQVVKVVDADITSDATYTLDGLFGSVSASSDYIVNVKESATLNIASATTLSSIEFNVDEGKTLTLTGFTLTATVGIKITGKGVVSTSVLTQLSGPLKGDGILAYTLSNGAANLPSGPTWTRTAWRGTIWLKNNKSLQNFDPGSFGHSGSTVRLTGMKGYFPNDDTTCAATVELVDDGSTAAFEQDNAYNRIYTFNKVKGSGTFKTSGNQSSGHNIVMKDVSEFTGQIQVSRRTVAIGAAPTSWPGVDGGTIYVASGTTATIEDAKTWKAKNVTVAGALKIKGSGSVTATGTVTCEGGKVDLSEAAANPTSAAISGTLAINASTTFDFPAGATFPYPVATSISGANSLASTSYTVGGTEGAGILRLASGKAYPATSATFAGGDSAIDWTDLVWTPSYGSDMGGAECSVTVVASGTLDLGTVVAGKVSIVVPSNAELTLDSGSITADEINFTGGGTVVCKAADTLVGKITGSVTIVYPEHTLPTGAIWTDTDWTGTNVFTNCGRQKNGAEGQQHGIVAFAQYGNENSFIRAPGYQGISASEDQNTTCEATIIVDTDTTFELNHGTDPAATEFDTHGAGYRFAKLVGDGLLKLDGTTDTAQYIFDDVSGFTGDVWITFPADGGRKSFLFAAESYQEVKSGAYAANLVIVDDVTVAAGKEWKVPAGIIINDGKKLTLGDGAKISALSPDSRGTLYVPAGTATLEGVTNGVVNATLDIAAGATLSIIDTTIKKLTIPANFTGLINLSGCTALSELHIVLGSLRTFDISKITLPGQPVSINYDIGTERDLSVYDSTITGTGVAGVYATETDAEYGAGKFVVSNVPDGSDLKVWLVRKNGTPIEAEAPTTAEDGTPDQRIYNGGSLISGSACWHDWDFEWTDGDKLRDYGKDYETIGVSLKTVVGSFSYSTDFKVGSEDKCSIPSYVHPYAEREMDFRDGIWSAAVRCTMPSKHSTVAIAFGDTNNGILGLASGKEDDVVEMFKWTPDGGGKYTTLAKLLVEDAADKMHIYALAVTNDTDALKNYVSLYRDGEFIHTAEFAFASTTITNFMVGAVLGDSNAAGLPSEDDVEATSGYVDYVRLYDKTIGEDIAAALSARRPFVSANETYVRTVTTGFADWDEANAWVSKTNDTLRTNVPGANTHVTFVAKVDTTAYVNIPSAATYNTLIFAGDSPITIASNGKGTIGAGMIVVRTAVTNNYGAVRFPEAMVGVDQGASLTFDFTDYPFAPTQEIVRLTGMVVAREYDETVDARIQTTGTPSHTWTVGAPSPVLDSEDPNYLCYYVTISPARTVGTTPIYYQSGSLEGGMEGDVAEGTGVFSTSDFTVPTILLTGDNVVVPSDFTSGDVSVYSTFDGNLNVQCTMLNITPVGASVLDGRTITAAAGCEVHFKGGDYGAMTLVGPGEFFFDEDATVETISGVGFVVVEGATLTLGGVEPFVTGTVGGTGTVKLPVGEYASINLNAYGSATGVLALSDSTTVALTVATVNPTLQIDGNVTITPVGGVANSLAKVTGTGDLTFEDGASAPASITIGEVADYSGTLINNSAVGVTVSKITLNADVAGGTLLLKKTGNVTVSAVHVGNDEYSKRFDVSDSENEWQLADAADGVYRASAKCGAVFYKTIQDAINAATDAGLDSITVLDESASVPTGYYYDSATKKVAKYAAAIVYATGTPSYYKTVQAAVYAANFLTYQSQEYLYVEAYVSEDVTTAMTLKVKPVDGSVTVNVTVPGMTSEMALTSNEADGVTTYTLALARTVYTWDSGLDSGVWNSMSVSPWRYSESGTPTQATRAPDTVDDVVFASDAVVVVGENISVASITNNASITLNKAGVDVTVTALSGGIAMTRAGASITVSGVTLSGGLTTTVAGTKVKTESDTAAGTTTYVVVPEVEYGEAQEYENEAAANVAADAAIAYMVVPEAVSALGASAVTDYKNLFEATKTETGDGKYVVSLDLTAAAKASIKGEIDEAFKSVDVDMSTGSISIDAKPGLKYVVETSDTAGSENYIAEGEPVTAESNSVSLTFTLPESGVKYYKIKVTP